MNDTVTLPKELRWEQRTTASATAHTSLMLKLFIYSDVKCQIRADNETGMHSKVT